MGSPFCVCVAQDAKDDAECRQGLLVAAYSSSTNCSFDGTVLKGRIAI